VTYGLSSAKGSAGAPLFKEDTGRLRVVAIHNGQAGSKDNFNYGIRMSDILKHQAGEKHSKSE